MSNAISCVISRFVAGILHIWYSPFLTPIKKIRLLIRKKRSNDTGVDILSWHQSRIPVEGGEDPPLDSISQVMPCHDWAPVEVLSKEAVALSPPVLLQ